MKKIIVVLILLFTFSGGYVVAESVNGSFEGNPIVKVLFGGKELTASDTPAIIYHDRTMVPLSLLQQAGFDVTWNASDYSVEVNEQQEWKPKVTIEDIKLLADRIGIIYGYDVNGVKKIQASGFIVSPDGLLITANHVIKDANNFTYGNYSFSTVDYRNSDLDYAGIKLSGLSGHNNDRFNYLPINTKIPNKGDKVFAMGFPNGKLTVTEGYITGTPQLRNITIIEDSAVIEGGSSGGVLFSDEGEVIGITVGTVEGTNINDTIPITYAIQK